jgi:hypothetical protein
VAFCLTVCVPFFRCKKTNDRRPVSNHSKKATDSGSAAIDESHHLTLFLFSGSAMIGGSILYSAERRPAVFYWHS